MLEPLTDREGDVLRLLAQGLTNREIAQRLVLSLETVKWYNKQLYNKLGVHKREQAVAQARELGLLDEAGIVLPGGTVTFLFSDIEGSTKLWQRQPARMGSALQRHDALLRRAIRDNAGRVFKTVGDAFYAVFDDALKALTAAQAAQQAILGHDWGETPIRVRMALHTGTAEVRDEDYFGPVVNHVAGLLSVGHGGQILLSASTRALVYNRLPKEYALRHLGEHRLKDLEGTEQIYQLVTPDLPEHFPALPSLTHFFPSLPAQRTSFVGRQQELAEVKRLLGATRLLTLTGAPGTGKTRLGLQVAAVVANEFEDGVYFIDLAPITDPGLVASTIAQEFEVRETAEQPLIRNLQRYFQDRRMLLLLDNFEQIIQAGPLVGELLSASPGLKVLVTSREGLQVYGEQEYIVPPLKLPDAEANDSLAELSQYEAMELFVQRAQAVKPDFALTEENAPAVAEICVRLDGLPLAIELAAARSKLFSPEIMAARLENRLMTLAGGARDLPARLRTLRDAIDWSYDLLDPPEKVLFARLAVFQGGRSLEAAEAVCGHDLAIDVLAGLESLLNKSLLRQKTGLDGEPRFIMLEMIHEYAWDRLEDSGQVEEIRQRQAAYCLALAEGAAPELQKAGRAYWSSRLRDEHNNVRAALAWSLDTGQSEVALRLVGALRDFWYYDGHSAEGLSWTQRALEGAGEAPLAVRAQALNTAGWLSYELNKQAQGRTYNSQALTLFRKLGDEVNTAWALAFLSTHFLALAGGPKESLGLCEEGLALFRKLDDRPGIIWALNGLGEIARMNGDYARAARAYEESLAMAREEGDQLRQAIPLFNQGYIAQHAGDFERAEALFLEGMALEWETGNRRYIAQNLASLAGPVAAGGSPEKATRLLGASEALLEKMGLVIQAADQFEIERYKAMVCEQLDEARFEKAMSEGRELSLEEAVVYALGKESL